MTKRSEGVTKMKAPPGKYDFHPAASAYPLMDKPELDALAHDIKTNSQKLPVILVKKKIIDGRNRYLACRQAGVPCRFETHQVAEEDIPAYIDSLNEHRRHLSKEFREKKAQIRRELARSFRNEGMSFRDIAERLNVSLGQVQRDLKEAVSGVSEDTPESSEKAEKDDSSPPEGPKTTGRDGKQYPKKKKPAVSNDALGPHTDRVGNALPDGLKDAFGDTQVQALADKLTAICDDFHPDRMLSGIASLNNRYLGFAALQKALLKAHDCLTEARDRCKGAVPYIICPECQGGAANNGHVCGHCFNLGWMSEAAHESYELNKK